MPQSLVSVVIPFYQKQTGVLAAAVLSVLRQEGISRVSVIVVDDGSPVSAADELTGLQVCAERASVRVLTQQNAGAGAARNRGLDNVEPGTEYVAFLDSDDGWLPHHLADAVHALEKGHDFYFADFVYPNAAQSELATKLAVSGRQHREIPGLEGLHTFCGDFFDDLLTTNFVGTSTVVYRFARFPQVRFREELYNGQDYLFWLDLLSMGPRIAFSKRTACRYGTGINIWRASGWGSEGALRRAANEVRIQRTVLRSFGLDNGQLRRLRRRLWDARVDVVRVMLHRLRRRHLEFDEALACFRADHPLILLFIPVALWVAAEAVVRRSEPDGA